MAEKWKGWLRFMQYPRLRQVTDSAAGLFIHQSYAKTKISHIVRDTGISTGAIYDMFAGKKALFQFVIRCTLDPERERNLPALPVQETALPELEEQVTQTLDAVVRRFEAPFLEKRADYSFRNMLSDAFDLLSQYRRGCLLFEANPAVFPALFAQYKQYRLHFYEVVKQYICLFMQNGSVRADINPGHCAKFVIETLYWWAMHVHYDGFNPDMAIPEEAAKQICLDALLHAYTL